MKRKQWLFVLLIILIGSSLACNLNLRGPEPPAPPIPVSTEEVTTLKESLEEAYAEGMTGKQVTIEITEAQLTSMAAFELQNQQDLDIKDPQVYLQNGEIQFFATVAQPAFEAIMKVVLTLDVNASGQPQFTFVSANIGPLNVPDSILSEVESYVGRAFSTQLDQMAADIVISSITIGDGVMTIVGQKK